MSLGQEQVAPWTLRKGWRDELMMKRPRAIPVRRTWKTLLPPGCVRAERMDRRSGSPISGALSSLAAWPMAAAAGDGLPRS